MPQRNFQYVAQHGSSRVDMGAGHIQTQIVSDFPVFPEWCQRKAKSQSFGPSGSSMLWAWKKLRESSSKMTRNQDQKNKDAVSLDCPPLGQRANSTSQRQHRQGETQDQMLPSVYWHSVNSIQNLDSLPAEFLNMLGSLLALSSTHVQAENKFNYSKGRVIFLIHLISQPKIHS